MSKIETVDGGINGWIKKMDMLPTSILEYLGRFKW
jgi:hypothetical protein